MLDLVHQPASIQLFIAASTFYLLYFCITRYNEYQRLKHFPGPPTTGISWLKHSWIVLQGQSAQWYGEVCEKYGPIARIAPTHLVTSDPELWERINAVRSPYRRSPYYYHAARFEQGKDNVFTDCNNDSHDARRKKMASGYSGKENPTLEPTIDVHVKELVDLVRKYATPPGATSKSMDLSQKIPFFTLDVISHVGLGEPFGDLKADQDQRNYLQSCEEGLRIINSTFAMGMAWLTEVPVLGPALVPSEKDHAGFGRMMAEARQIVNARKEKSTDQKSDMIASFIRNGVSGDDLFQEVFEQILAGSDTTAAGIKVTLLYLMTNPRVYARLQAEIDKIEVKSEVISDSAARQLPYLSAVVREAFRCHPPVANIFSKITPNEGDKLMVNGKEMFIPGGTLIGYSALSMHRNNRTLYGEDSHVFRPERWFIEDKDRLARMTKTNEMVFGYGRWQCLGKNIALLEVHKSIFELLRHFDLSLQDPHKPWKTFNTLGLWEIKDMWVNVTERS